MKTPRGIRNNNPLNIRKGDKWKGISEIQQDECFVQFMSMRWGIRAAFIILHRYMTIHKLNTIRGIISRWAPENENNTQAYIAYVSRETGIHPDSELVYFDMQAMVRLVKAMAYVENGQAIDQVDIIAGYALFTKDIGG